MLKLKFKVLSIKFLPINYKNSLFHYIITSIGLHDAWENVSIMENIENLLRTLYTMFCQSSIKKKNFEELA